MRALPALVVSGLLTGCQSLTGMPGATERFGCKAPHGVTCSSVSGVHANLQHSRLATPPSATGAVPATTPATMVATDAANIAALAPPVTVPAAGTPLRSEPRILRIWIAPWIDDDETLHDAAFLYTQIDPGRWRIGELRRERPAPTLRRAEPAGSASASVPENTVSTSRQPDQQLIDVRGNPAAQSAARAIARPAPSAPLQAPPRPAAETMP